MRTIRIFLACLLAIPVSACDRRPSASLETEIARIDGLVADHDTKFQVIEAMARDLGTHRNHLVLLKKQELDSFAQILSLIHIFLSEAGEPSQDTSLARSLGLFPHAVSYTHLDVYKRQALSSVAGPCRCAPSGGWVRCRSALRGGR